MTKPKIDAAPTRPPHASKAKAEAEANAFLVALQTLCERAQIDTAIVAVALTYHDGERLGAHTIVACSGSRGMLATLDREIDTARERRTSGVGPIAAAGEA